MEINSDLQHNHHETMNHTKKMMAPYSNDAKS